MDESLIERRRVYDEVFRNVKYFYEGRTLTVPEEKASANSVPAAAVIRGMQALSGIIGRKGCVGGYVSLSSNLSAQPRVREGNGMTRGWERFLELMV